MRMPCFSACSTRSASDWPARSGVVTTTSVSGSLPLRRQTFQDSRGILDRAQKRAAVNAPAGLARADCQQALDLQQLPPVPGQRAQEQVDVLGRARPPEPTAFRVRSP